MKNYSSKAAKRGKTAYRTSSSFRYQHRQKIKKHQASLFQESKNHGFTRG